MSDEKSRAHSDAEWYCRKDPEEERFYHDLSLSLAQHILDDPFAGLGIVTGGVAPLPAAVACVFLRAR